MPKKTAPHTAVSEPASGDLREACTKLRGMAYLIELCGEHPTPPLDERHAFYGVSLVLTDIHDEILEFARAFERWEICRAQRRAEWAGPGVNQNEKTVKLG